MPGHRASGGRKRFELKSRTLVVSATDQRGCECSGSGRLCLGQEQKPGQGWDLTNVAVTLSGGQFIPPQHRNQGTGITRGVERISCPTNLCIPLVNLDVLETNSCDGLISPKEKLHPWPCSPLPGSRGYSWDQAPPHPVPSPCLWARSLFGGLELKQPQNMFLLYISWTCFENQCVFV